MAEKTGAAAAAGPPGLQKFSVVETEATFCEDDYLCSCLNFINIDVDGRIYYSLAKFIQHGLGAILPHSRPNTLQTVLEHIVDEAFDPTDKYANVQDAMIDIYKRDGPKGLVFRLAKIIMRFYEEVFPLMKSSAAKRVTIIETFGLTELTKIFIYNFVLDLDKMQIPEGCDRILYVNFIEDLKREFGREGDRLPVFECVRRESKSKKK